MNTIWDPEILSRAARIQLRARELAWGYQIGQHASKRVAKGIEFIDTKEYTPGDPIRDIDWRVMARSDRLVIRRQVAETELTILFVLDASGDMIAPSEEKTDSPFERAVVLIATLALLLQRRGNRVGLLVLGGTGFEQSYLTPSRASKNLTHLMMTLAAVEPKGRANLNSGFEFCAEHSSSRSICMVFSDLMEDASGWPESLSALSARRVDVRVAHLFSRQEYELEFDQPLKLFSQEDLGHLPIDPETLRDAFMKVCSEYESELINHFSTARSIYVSCPIENGASESVLRLLRGI